MGEFFVDRGIVKADLRGIGSKIAEVDFFNPGPIDCAQAHGTWFAGCVDVTAAQFKGTEFLASQPYGQHFGVGRGIVRRGDLIYRFRDYFAVLHDYGAERPTASRTDILY